MKSHAWSNYIKIVFLWGQAFHSVMNFRRHSRCLPGVLATKCLRTTCKQCWAVSSCKAKIGSGRYSTGLLSSFNTIVRPVEDVVHIFCRSNLWHVSERYTSSTGSSVPLASSRAARFSTGASRFAFVFDHQRERFKGLLQYYKVLVQYYSVLESTTQYTTLYYKVLLQYYKVLFQYYSVLQSTTLYYKVLLCTTKCYPVLHSTTPVLLCTTKYYKASSTLYYKASTTLYYKLALTIDPRYIWNLIYNAQSNRSHPPTSPNTAPATKSNTCDWSLAHMKR